MAERLPWFARTWTRPQVAGRRAAVGAVGYLFTATLSLVLGFLRDGLGSLIAFASAGIFGWLGATSSQRSCGGELTRHHRRPPDPIVNGIFTATPALFGIDAAPGRWPPMGVPTTLGLMEVISRHVVRCLSHLDHRRR